MTWLREEHSAMAAQNILDAATTLFVERGVNAVGMADVAKAAGCSRQTLYRYFDSRQDLHLAFAQREAVRLIGLVSDEVKSISDPADRLVTMILALLHEVRNTDYLSAWFRSGEPALAAEIANSSPMIESLAPTVSLDLTRWCVRVTLSLLITPGTDSDDERRMLEQFVAPLIKTGVSA